jgi:hypothetical protein
MSIGKVSRQVSSSVTATAPPPVKGLELEGMLVEMCSTLVSYLLVDCSQDHDAAFWDLILSSIMKWDCLACYETAAIGTRVHVIYRAYIIRADLPERRKVWFAFRRILFPRVKH